jgi:HAD superfamily hydrolase (TIGR01509 family)
MPLQFIFIDLGGVINDEEQQSAQWQNLAGECFARLLGGAEEGWAEAHRTVTRRPSEWEKAQDQTPADFISFYWSYQLHWIRGMCGYVGLPAPPEEVCLALARRAIVCITSRVHAPLPGAVEAIRTLHLLGHTLHTASGSCSLELAGYLDGLGVRNCFGRLYGADLINTFKEGPEFYARLFADAGTPPAEALVVDDSTSALNWAAQVGARTVLVSPSSNTDDAETGAIRRIGSLAELPASLQSPKACWTE